ncbi:hypothetical protein [Actinoplanes awajinensis]|uniref:Uncharacterized protein n=1 Tax=Actinoplanes awajinensis subsp. mycoplanecinus TaxID=135947 RepID=A0A117MPM8_9ACTN|nr:hypothetical protein [Actinoplanes awajinensis]KUL28867.1 hypothetical protein ADL15_30680 [Actinoplanes awajinensis subsp. mycoplanecinus]
MWHWTPTTILVVSLSVIVAAVLLLTLVLRGTNRVVRRVRVDLVTAADPFGVRVLLAYGKGRDPARLLALAASHRRPADVPPDLVEPELTAWIKKRVPGWSPRGGVRVWTALLVLVFGAFALSCYGVMLAVAAQAGGPDPVWGSRDGSDALGYLAASVLVTMLPGALALRIGTAIEDAWGDQLIRPCVDRVGTEVDDGFLEELAGPGVPAR